MHDSRTELAADAAEIPDLVEQAMDDGGALAARSWVDGEARRLVDHQQIRVVVEDGEIELHGIEPRRRDLRQPKEDPRSGARPIRR